MTGHDPAMERARQRAHQLRDYYGHLITYVVVCTILVVIDLADSSTGTEFIGLNWAYWPILGWGIAILIHTVTVVFPLADWEERKTQQLYERERDRLLRH